MQDVLPHVKRMVDELDQLNEKVSALKSFIVPDHPIYSKLSNEDQLELTKQLWYMVSYSGVLTRRINKSKQ